MITVVIVEDEILELNALKNDIDYASLGMQIVGTACDGETALALLREKTPDVLITDIVIPGLNGLELLRFAKELRPDMYAIIISGHQRFDYAQLAIKYGVERFLTKPLHSSQLWDLLQNISLSIQQHNRKQFEEEFFIHELNANMPLLRDMFVHSLIEGSSFPDISKRLAYYNITLADAPLAAMCLLADETSDITILSLRRSVVAFFENEGCGYCITSLSFAQTSVLCVLFQCQPADSAITIYDLAERLRIAVLTDSGFLVTIGTGCIGSGWTDIPSCVATAKQALEYRFYLGIGQVISFYDISAKEYIGSPHLIRQLFPLILAAANEGDSSVIEQLCSKLYHNASISALSPQHVRILFTELMSCIISSRSESGLDGLEKNDIFSLYTKLLSTETLEDMVSQIKQELITVKKSKDNYIIGREEWLVEKIKEIIKAQYAENLTIDTIARQVYISSGYATRLFRKHTGDSINNYIIQTRMAVAANILKDPSITISEAATKTGYSNIAYFSSVFRKTYSYTPREWRDMHAKTTKK